MTTEKGAEATVRVEENVVKTREKKSYRHEALDRKLRHERTRREAELMQDARHHGVNVPEVEKTAENELEMDRIDGEPLKEVIEDTDAVEELGVNIAYLHSTGIIHGDLTTSNVIVSDEPHIIDFGLSFRSRRIEDMAVDIHLFRQVLESSHPETAEEAWKRFRDGYSEFDRSGEVMDQLEEVEKRGRYK